MPIDYKKYPKNWKSEIRPRILKRADNCCEFEGCGLENNTEVYSWKNPCDNKTNWTKSPPDHLESKKVKVVLTIAHLDHDEYNHEVKDNRLMAMCQLHHLRYDQEEKKRRRNLND